MLVLNEILENDEESNVSIQGQSFHLELHLFKLQF